MMCGNILKTWMMALVLIISGCASDAIERDRGTSARKLVTGQVFDPETLTKPSPEVLSGMDGERAVKDVNNVYRDTDVPLEARRQIKLKRILRSVED